MMGELFEMRRQEKGASTVHHLSTLPGMPTQRDQRIRRLAEYLCDKGLVTRVAIGELTGYELNKEGEQWWIRYSPGMGLFRSLHQSDANP